MRSVEKYPPANRIAACSELREKYERARAEIQSYKTSAHVANGTARSLAKDKHKYQSEAKVANRQLLQLSKRQKASDEAKKAGYWSGAATISVTILYEMWKVVGFPGGYRWADFWAHEAVYGVMVWCSTMVLGILYRAAHKDA